MSFILNLEKRDIIGILKWNNRMTKKRKQEEKLLEEKAKEYLEMLGIVEILEFTGKIYSLAKAPHKKFYYFRVKLKNNEIKTISLPEWVAQFCLPVKEEK